MSLHEKLKEHLVLRGMGQVCYKLNCTTHLSSATPSKVWQKKNLSLVGIKGNGPPLLSPNWLSEILLDWQSMKPVCETNISTEVAMNGHLLVPYLHHYGCCLKSTARHYSGQFLTEWMFKDRSGGGMLINCYLGERERSGDNIAKINWRIALLPFTVIVTNALPNTGSL